MSVVVKFRLMAGVVVIMPAVFSAVIMVMHVGAGAMRVLVEMFVQMLVSVSVSVGVFMAVLRVSMGMFVGVRVAMVMRVQMFVLVFSFHNHSSCSSG